MLDTSDYEDNLDDASKKTNDFADKLKKGLATAAKVGAAAIGAASAAVGALTKQSIEGYAEYEQLVGGVETLFKDSADTVMEYANNAYKTAGLSANEYMETVTSFSASLLQSLGGDTEAAAQVADMAITDMSDNANKMGTAIDSIQNAYQGFAKQNFTMLDNLKLGYGGTKEEMQRLLEDAEKLSGIEYDISSYADIVDAIHVVQTEMGITGTTAAEAASTIEGSVAAAKSAWSNLVTGIADENADLDILIDNFVDSAATAAENIIPRVEKIITGIGDLVIKLAPVIEEKLPQLMDAILPSLISAATVLVIALASAIPDMLSVLVDAALKVVDEIGNGLAEKIPFLSGLFENLEVVVTAAAAAFVAYKTASAISGVIETLTKVTETQTIAQAALNAVMNANPFVLVATAVAALVAGFVTLLATNEKLLDGFIEIWDGITSAISSAVEKIGEIIDGIKDKFSSVVSGVKDLLGIHSPSRVFAGIGENMALGLGAGWEDEFSSIKSKIQKGMSFDAGTIDFESSGMFKAGMMISNSIISDPSRESGGDFVINLTAELDGEILSRKMYRFNQKEENRRGPELVMG